MCFIINLLKGIFLSEPTPCIFQEVECVAPRAHDGTLVTITIKYICEIHKNTPQFLQIANLMFKK